MTQHTTTPWKAMKAPFEVVRYDIAGRTEFRIFKEGTGDFICQTEKNIHTDIETAEANAAFIVEACNSHKSIKDSNAELLAALQKAALRMGDFGAAHYDPTGEAEARAAITRATQEAGL